MIRINKSAIIPAILSGRGVMEKTAICVQYNLNPAVYNIKYHKINNPHKLAFRPAIYGDPSVKAQLISDQHEKCCFCEGTFLENAHGDVEHYRPKGGYKQKETDPIGKPGYYWLAYDWDNLMFSCQICNQIYKKNLFPLTMGTARAMVDTDVLEGALNCLLINPNQEDPQTFISFNDHMPVGLNEKGKRSIISYGLKRKRLLEARQKYLNEVTKNLVLSVFDFATITPAQIVAIKVVLGGVVTDADVKNILDSAAAFASECAKSHYPYTNMVRRKYPHLPHV